MTATELLQYLRDGGLLGVLVLVLWAFLTEQVFTKAAFNRERSRGDKAEEKLDILLRVTPQQTDSNRVLIDSVRSLADHVKALDDQVKVGGS